MIWYEWDGRGFDDAVAYAEGTWFVHEFSDVVMQIRQLGIEFPAQKSLELVHGWIGVLDGDIVLDACDRWGATWNDEDDFVDEDSLRPATFAIFVDWD